MASATIRGSTRRAAMLLAIMAATPGCGACIDREELGPVVEGPVRARFVVRKEAWLKISRSARNIDGVLVIASAVPVEHATDCHEPHPELQGDPTGTRFAYRCAPTERWRLVHVGQRGGSWETCRTDGGSGPAVDFATLPDFEGAAAELAVCAKKSAGPVFAELASRRAGLAADVLIATAAETFGAESATGDDAWFEAERALPPEQRTRVREALVARMRRPQIEGPAAWRALVLGAPQAVSDDLLFARAAEIAATVKLHADTEARHFLGAATRMLVRAGPARARAVGELVCTRLVGAEGRGLDVHLYTALAASGVPCPAVGSSLGCVWAYDCGEAEKAHVCTAAELDAALAVELLRDPLAAVRGDDSWSGAHAHLAVAYRSKAVSESFLRKNARRHYVQEPASPSCWSADTLGQPCACFGSEKNIDDFACGTPAEVTVGEESYCAIVIDDANRRFLARHRCSADDLCSKGIDCCAGTTCQQGFCRPAPSASASAAPSASASAAPAAE